MLMKRKNMSNIDKINNCPVCGTKLIKERYLDHYSVEDGSEIYYLDVACPNNHWFHTHYHNIFDENGNSCAYWSTD